MIITLWLIATITFFLMQLLPGTPYTNQERLSPETIEMLNKQVGLDKPVIIQYGIYLSNLLQRILNFPLKTAASRTFVSWKNRTILAVRVTGNYLWNSPRDDFRNDLCHEAKYMGRYIFYTRSDIRSFHSKLCICCFITIYLCNQITSLANRKMGWLCVHNLTNNCVGHVAAC